MINFIRDEKPVVSGLKPIGTGSPARDHEVGDPAVDERRRIALAHYLPTALQYDLPRRDADTERKSLLQNAKRFRPVAAPHDIEEAIEYLVAKSPRYTRPEYILPGPVVAPQLVAIIISFLNPDANAGYPYCTEGLMKQDYAIQNFAFVYALVCSRLFKLGNLTLEQIKTLEPMEAIELGLCDPWRVIVKNEPHTLEKLEQHRERLICCASVVDEIIDRIISTRPNKALIAQFAKTFSALGIGFDDAKVAMVTKAVMSHPGRKVDSDMSSWEWTVQGWDYDIDAQVELRTCDGIDDVFRRLILNRNELCKRGIYVLSDGSMYEQLHAGVNKSGSYKTATRNTRVRAANSFLIGSMWQLCAGDDCVEEEVPDMVARYEELGKVLKDCTPVNDGFNFCSHSFCEGKAIPQRLAKAAFKYITSDPSFDKAVQFAYVYQRCPKFEDALRGIVAASKYGKPSRSGGEVKSRRRLDNS